MVWGSTLITREAALAYLGGVQIDDDALDDLGNEADATIVHYCGAHPVISHADDTPAEITDKANDITRRGLALKRLTQLFIRERDEGLPAFKGWRMSAADYEARRMDILRTVGVRDWEDAE